MIEGPELGSVKGRAGLEPAGSGGYRSRLDRLAIAKRPGPEIGARSALRGKGGSLADLSQENATVRSDCVSRQQVHKAVAALVRLALAGADTICVSSVLRWAGRQ